MVPRLPKCYGCLHKAEGALKCDAFPDGIPLDIVRSLVGHTKPYPGDRGIRFKPLEKS